MHNSGPFLENARHKLLWDFNIHTHHLIPARRPNLIIINKKGTFKIVNLAVPADHRIKLKEPEKKDKYLDLARELKKLWNMQVTIIPIVIGAFGTVTKGLLKGLEDLDVGGRVNTIQTTALLRTARILRRVLDTCGELLSLKLQWKTIGYCWCEKLKWGNNNNRGKHENLESGIDEEAFSKEMLYHHYYSKLPWCHLTTYKNNAQPDTNLVDRR